jgi:hypothetical protein
MQTWSIWVLDLHVVDETQLGEEPACREPGSPEPGPRGIGANPGRPPPNSAGLLRRGTVWSASVSASCPSNRMAVL